MIIDNTNITDEDLLKNKAKRIISVNYSLSTGLLKAKLVKKGIPVHIVDDMVVEDENQQIENARRLIDARYQSIKGKSEFERRQKMVKCLMNKGFSYQVASRAMNEYEVEI